MEKQDVFPLATVQKKFMRYSHVVQDFYKAISVANCQLLDMRMASFNVKIIASVSS